MTGDDDTTVRNVINIIATPPFRARRQDAALRRKTGRDRTAGHRRQRQGRSVEGPRHDCALHQAQLGLSTLQASDFSQGAAKYVTQTIDDTLVERKVANAKDAQKLSFEAKEAGVYVVQVEAYDKIGRRQQVSVDFFVGGQTPVLPGRAPRNRDRHDGQGRLRARRNGDARRAVAVPEGARSPSSEDVGAFQIHWIDIDNGFGRYATTLARRNAETRRAFSSSCADVCRTAPNSSRPSTRAENR